MSYFGPPPSSSDYPPPQTTTPIEPQDPPTRLGLKWKLLIVLIAIVMAFLAFLVATSETPGDWVVEYEHPGQCTKQPPVRLTDLQGATVDRVESTQLPEACLWTFHVNGAHNGYTLKENES